MRPDPVLLLGAPRSGTTYLRVLLCQHPEIDITHETRLFTWVHRALVELPRDPKTLATHEDRFLAHLRDRLPELIRDFHRSLTPGVRVWGDKNPFYASKPEILETVDELFPGARYLHIIRDGRDVVVSLLRKAETKGWKVDFERAHQLWLESVHGGQAFGASCPERYLELRYEELVSDDVAWALRALEFLDVDVHEDVVRFCREQRRRRTPVSQPTTDLENAGAPASGWAGYLDDDGRRRSMRLIGRELERLGYQLP